LKGRKWHDLNRPWTGSFCRAIFIARGFGADVRGYVAEDVSDRHSIKTRLREQLAKIAALTDVILRRRPKFLGPVEDMPK